MKRWTIRVVVFLLIGAIVNVAVAWSTVAAPGWRGMKPSRHEIKGKWPFSVPRHWPPADTLFHKESFGLVVQSYHGYAWTNDLSSRHYSVMVFRCGLPVSALQCHRFSEFAPNDPQREQRFNAYPEKSRWEIGLPIPRMLPGFRETQWKALPLRPIWPGFAVNTVFYASILWVLWSSPFTARRMIRHRRGHCIKCGYDLRGAEHEACPECGSVREVVEAQQALHYWYNDLC